MVALAAAWGVAAVAMALAALFALRASRAARAVAHERMVCGSARRSALLAEAALAEGAMGAVRLDAEPFQVTGRVPGPILAALAAHDGPLGPAAAALADEGTPFRIPFRGRVLLGQIVQSHPTVFVKLPGAGALDAAGDGSAYERLCALVADGPHPAWVEGPEATIQWANEAYMRAVGAGVDARDAEPLLDANARPALADATLGALAQRVQTVVKGERRTLDVVARGDPPAALAVDVTDSVRDLAQRTRQLESHAATFDRLGTGIAMFGPDRRLAFHNAAFQTLWDLPSALLADAPAEEEVLDHLRAERRLPEMADFESWKREQLRGYETRETFERWWHLPDGQSLRVIASPGADGGVTYIYENVTEQLALERRYNAMSRVQVETIDNLGEGIATFGPDGLLRLANPAFWALSGAEPSDVGDHVSAIGATVPAGDVPVWRDLAELVTGFTDHRTAVEGRLEREDGSRVLDYAFSPLPDGSTLATFTDVTDRVNVARALVERNSALVEADRLKNAFIEHVSYELRSPLTTIIGFTQILARPETGALNARQREYTDYISTSSEALLTIIDGILDLATIDAGIMELEHAPVDVADTVQRALDGLKDRIAEAALDVRLDVGDGARFFDGDPQRVRQILFNLLSNAVAHSPQGGEITVEARRDDTFVAISVRDRGVGIDAAKAEAVFERFMTGAGQGGRRGGVGLGLSLVKGFVELHGGSVSVVPVDGPGAEVMVRFPRYATRTGSRSTAASGEAEAQKRAA